MFANNWENKSKHSPKCASESNRTTYVAVTKENVSLPASAGGDTKSTRIQHEVQHDKNGPVRLTSGLSSIQLKFYSASCISESMAGNFRRLPRFPADFSRANFCNEWGRE